MNRVPRPSINPILLKELRQAVRSKAIAGAYCMFLLVQVIVTGAMLLAWRIDAGYSAVSMLGMGRSVFQALFVPLTVICVMFVPLYAGIRIALERSDDHLDLQFVTRLTPAMIVRGKWFCSLALVALMTSAALPFLTLTFYLGGIDVPSALLILLLMTLVAAMTTLFALMIGALPGSRPWRLLMGLVATGLLIGIIGMLQSAADGVIRHGAAAHIATASFWKVAGPVTGAGIILGGLLFCVCMLRISPPAANRSMPLRVWITMSWIAWGITMIVYAKLNQEFHFMFFWMAPTVVICFFALAASICERPDFGRRLRRSIPGNPILRLLVFPFFSGNVPGTLWSVMIGVATVGVSYWMLMVIHSAAGWTPSQYNRMIHAVQITAGMLAYGFAYSQTAFWLWLRFGRKWLSRANVWVIFILLVAVGSVIPLLAAIAGTARRPDDWGAWAVGNPFLLFSDIHKSGTLRFSLSWGALMLVPFVIMLVKSYTNFKPLARGAASGAPSGNKP